MAKTVNARPALVSPKTLPHQNFFCLSARASITTNKRIQPKMDPFSVPKKFSTVVTNQLKIAGTKMPYAVKDSVDPDAGLAVIESMAVFKTGAGIGRFEGCDLE